MRLISNLDNGGIIQIPIYELFAVEISYTPTIGEQLSDVLFQDIKNCEILKEFYIEDNPCSMNSDGKMIYIMIPVKPVISTLLWSINGTVYKHDFNFTLNVIPIIK